MGKGGVDLGTHAIHLFAYQVQGVAFFAVALGNLQQAARGHHTLLLFPHRLRYGTDSHHGCQRVTGLCTDIDIGIGSNHRRGTAGTDIHIVRHRVRPGFLACS